MNDTTREGLAYRYHHDRLFRALVDQLVESRISDNNPLKPYLDKAENELAQVLASLKTVREACRFDQPWSLLAIFSKLMEATRHLLDDHDCDAYGHEAFAVALKESSAAYEALSNVVAALTPAEGGK